MFGLHLVKEARIEPRWAADLGLSLEDRVKADYNVFAHFSEGEARDERDRAVAFLRRIRQYLLANGLDDDDVAAIPTD